MYLVEPAETLSQHRCYTWKSVVLILASLPFFSVRISQPVPPRSEARNTYSVR